jgi:hypothetical protein
VESFLDSHSREKYVYKSEMDLLLKVKRHMACKGINDIQIPKSMFALDKKLHRFFFLFNHSRCVFESTAQPQVTVFDLLVTESNVCTR